LINEEVSRQVIAIVERGNIRSAKMVIDLMRTNTGKETRIRFVKIS